MKNRFELKKEYDHVMSNANKMSPKEWEEAYMSLHECCDEQTVLIEHFEKAIEAAYGESVCIDVANSAAKSYLEIIDMENEEVEIPPEQEKMLEDLY